MNFKIEILKADYNFKDSLGDRYIRYYLKINDELCEYLLAKSPVPNYFYSYPKSLYGWPAERAEDLNKLEKQVEKAIESYELKKNLTPKTAQTFNDLIDEL
jgi:hypothetical protein